MSKNNSSGGIGVTGLLLVAFIVLKLCHVINWSWWWVLAPAWIPAIIALICFIYLYKLAKDVDKEVDHRQSKWADRIEQMRKEREKKA